MIVDDADTLLGRGWDIPMNKIAQHKEVMKKFAVAINTNNKILARELISERAEFSSLISDEKLQGSDGYMSVVDFMRQSFSDIHWEILDMAAEADKVAVSWLCKGTHDGVFMGNAATGKTFAFRCMNFYYFDGEGKIINDVAAEGLIGILSVLDMIKTVKE